MYAQETLTVIRLINIIIITLSITAWVIFYFRYKTTGAIAPITWLIHVLIYGIYRYFISDIILNSIYMNIWTALLITHAAILLLVSACLSIPGVEHKRK